MYSCHTICTYTLAYHTNDKSPPPSDATGATVGQLPCIPIASSVTSYGRDLLFQTKAFVEKHYTIENGFPYNAEVRLNPVCACSPVVDCG